MPASTMLSGVAKSGSPISRCTIFLPCASSARALASTTNAPSVPNRDIRSANLIVTRKSYLVHAEQRAAIHPKRLPRDVPSLTRAKERASRGELKGLAKPPGRRIRGHALELLLRIGTARGGHLAHAVREDLVRRQAVDGDPIA